MDEASFVAMQKEKLVAEGQLHESIAHHPQVTSQIVEAWRRQFGGT